MLLRFETKSIQRLNQKKQPLPKIKTQQKQFNRDSFCSANMSIKRNVSTQHGGKNSAHWHILNVSQSSSQKICCGRRMTITYKTNTSKHRHSKALWLCSSSMIKSVSDSLKATIDQPAVSSPRKVKTTSKPQGLLLAMNFLIVYCADSSKNCSSLEESLNTNIFPLWQHVYTKK